MGNPDCQFCPATYLGNGADRYSGACFPRNTDSDTNSTYTDSRFEQMRVGTRFGTFYIERAGRRSSDHTIVLLHGFGTNAALWRGVGARLARRGYHVLAPDLLGHSASEWPAHAPYTMTWHADSLAAALESMGVARATVMGQDTGGLVALQMAARHPEVVQQLVLVNPPDHRTMPPTAVSAMLRVAERLPDGASHEAHRADVLPGHVAGHRRQADNELVSTALVAALLAQGTANPDQLCAATVARYLAPWLVDGSAAQLCWLARNLANDTVPPDTIAAVVAPTLILRGERDCSVPEGVARTLAASLENALLRTFPHHGRLLAEEAPDTLTDTLTGFITDSRYSMATEAAVRA